MLRWEEVSATRVVCKLGDLKVCAIERIPNSHTWCTHVYIYRDMSTWKNLSATTLEDAQREAIDIVKQICSDQIAMYQSILQVC